MADRHVAVGVVTASAFRANAGQLIQSIHAERLQRAVVGSVVEIPRRIILVAAIFAGGGAVSDLQLTNFVKHVDNFVSVIGLSSSILAELLNKKRARQPIVCNRVLKLWNVTPKNDNVSTPQNLFKIRKPAPQVDHSRNWFSRK